MASATPSVKEPTSPREARDSRHEDAPEKQKADKHLDRTKQLKRDESRDRLGVSGGEGSAKRHRSSATPPHLGSSEKDMSEGPAKKRRLDVDGKDKKLRLASSAEERSSKPGSTKEGSLKSKAGQKLREEDERKASVSAKPKKRDVSRESSLKERSRATPPIERNITVKTEDMDVDMPDADRAVTDKETPARASKPKEDEARKSKQADAEAAAASAAAAEAKKRAEVQKRKDDEEKRKREEEEEAKKHREEEDKRRKEEEQRKRAEEDERKRKEEEEAKKQQREEAEKRRLEDARKQREEEERKRQEEERKRKMEEEERQKQEEEERLRKEQLEREAAEEARRLREEELRKEQERRDRLQREELERRRLVREAEQRRIAEERRAKLPPLFQWLDICSNPKSPNVAKRFCMLQGFRYDTINEAAKGTDAGRELWLVNSQVALLLGEKDLSLGRYTAWQRIPAPKPTNQVIVRLHTDIIGLIGQDDRDFALQLPGYYPPQYHTTGKLHHDVRSKMRNKANEKFRQMDLFFIKASEVLFLVPTMPHLRDLRITVCPRELPKSMTQLTSQNYKSDPDVEKYRGFAPGPRHYVNGQFVGEDLPRKAATSKQPYPDYRVPRRGLIAVPRDDPDYARLCQEQGLSHLLSPAASSPVLPNGVHSSPSTAASPQSDVSGATTPSGLSKTGFAGHNETRSPGYPTNSVAGIKAHADGKPLVNGINHDGAVNGDGQH